LLKKIVKTGILGAAFGSGAALGFLLVLWSAKYWL
jgi:hypothetical protein